ncbi:MAG TPA: selenocysteine lyase, partial [Bacteroidales bacterium]|nr:selenocysteine lyase [Bacteroidales bacterium]
LSLHPTMTNGELVATMQALKEIQLNHKAWQEDYTYSKGNNEFIHKSGESANSSLVSQWFSLR